MVGVQEKDDSTSSLMQPPVSTGTHLHMVAQSKVEGAILQTHFEAAPSSSQGFAPARLTKVNLHNYGILQECITCNVC